MQPREFAPQQSRPRCQLAPPNDTRLAGKRRVCGARAVVSFAANGTSYATSSATRRRVSRAWGFDALHELVRIS
eukprot:5744155-Pleurochrysis_carterae.AAC.3